MSAKKLVAFLFLVVAIIACRFGSPARPTPQVTLPPVTDIATEEPAASDITAKLEELGGEACEENPDFTCVTIPVPLNHFDAANTETLDVVFAVSPASGERYGMFVQAFPGGPGGEGISSSSLSWFSDDILEHYDIVFFDQRGIGLSSPLTCEKTIAEDYRLHFNDVDDQGEEGLDTPQEQQEYIDEARTYVESCINEMGIAPEKLKFYGTDQVAEDIETFRQVIGDEKIWLYGVSYGTQVAEIYAASHKDHLAMLVLDGTVDLTLTGEEFLAQQEQAFEKVLRATLESCNQDELCSADMNGDAVEAYMKLAQKLSNAPITYQYPLPTGETVKRIFTFDHLETAASYQMYSLGGRMIFLRALAEANRGNMVLMARILYQQTTIDPTTQEYIGDPTFSDTMSTAVDCTDVSYFDGTPEERIAKVMEAGQASNGIEHPIDGFIYFGVVCANWPSAPATETRSEPLVAEGVTTFVLNAKLDPATPFENGKAVYQNLADGYHLYAEGGIHSIYGWGYDCPDQYITDFMMDGTVPDQREILCEDWGTNATRAYEPLIEENASAYADVLEIFSAIDREIQFQPEYYYSYFEEDTIVACPHGGTFTFGPSDLGEAYTFDNCTYTKGFTLNGTGSFDYDSSIFTIEAQVSGLKEGTLTYTHNYNDDTFSVSGDYGGKAIDLSK